MSRRAGRNGAEADDRALARARLVEHLDREVASLEVLPADRFESKSSAARLRRLRRGAGGDDVGYLTLVDDDGILRWVTDPVPRAIDGRRRRRRRGGAAGSDVVSEYRFALLPPNQIVAAIESLDRKFAAKDPQGEPVLGLRRWQGEQLVPAEAPKSKGRGKRILLFVHGTFSNCDHLFREEVLSTRQGREWIAHARFDEILTFDHPTLAASPVLNACELSRAMRGVEAEVCVVAHSRGGLVVRWWLEAFGGASEGPRRAVLVGSPVAGTSLAAPDRIRNSLDLLTNFGSALQAAGAAASAFAPLLAAPVVLLKVFCSVTSAFSRLPLPDAGVALVPGLAGQSRAGNNHELRTLRNVRPDALPQYAIIRSNFETKAAGWRFWEFFRKKKLLDLAADHVFPGRNDLVVDFDATHDFCVHPSAAPPRILREWDQSAEVHHVNYFRQRETIDAIARAL